MYSYRQKTVVAPTQVSEVIYERKVEKLAVTKCKKEKVKDGYKEKIVEVCKQEHVEVPFTLPSVVENINEFIELSIPEPDENCQTYRYEIPEVNCRVRRKVAMMKNNNIFCRMSQPGSALMLHMLRLWVLQSILILFRWSTSNTVIRELSSNSNR